MREQSEIRDVSAAEKAHTLLCSVEGQRQRFVWPTEWLVCGITWCIMALVSPCCVHNVQKCIYIYMIYIYMCVHLYVYDTCIWECWFLYVCITLPKQPKMTCCYCAFYFCKCFYCLTVFLLSVCKVMSPVKDKFLLPLGQTINYLSIYLSIYHRSLHLSVKVLRFWT